MSHSKYKIGVDMGSGDSQSIFLCIPKANKERNTMIDYITIEDFIHEIEELGLTYKRGAFNLYIEDNERPIARVHLYQPLQADTCYDNLNYKNPAHLALYELVNRYTRALLNKRETEKRYRLRLDVSSSIENNWQILGKNVDDGCYHIGSGRGSEKWQTIFTQSEIDEMGDITRGFVKEEV